ncbi:uncharacterized protein LOC125963855 isoform X2 [Orcinus orca]|uniref:uncharacterized protein LOC125963855 isoform X2 n=1 Tax=Orcinus orca TaxID=9733 RepID=UPI00211219BC|nr:uncharacterized protein LOC125963855 isoform X2 [Orcinus orca]
MGNCCSTRSLHRILQQPGVWKVWKLIRSHDGPVAGLYIRAHSNLPGPLTKLNATADVLTRSKRDLYPVHFPPKNRVEVTPPPPQSLFPKAGHIPIYRTPPFRSSCCQEWLMYCIHYLHTLDTHGPCPGHPHIMGEGWWLSQIGLSISGGPLERSVNQHLAWS